MSATIGKKTKEYYALCAADMFQHRELKRVLAAFSQQSVDTMLLKGAFLKHKVYENSLLRPMGDIDLLIKDIDKEAALSALKKMGYADKNEGKFFAEDERGVLELARSEGSYTHELDLHTHLVNLPGLRPVMDIPEKLAWEKAEQIFMDGIPCFSLPPELLFLYLCYHVSVHHSFYDETWYRDFHEILKACRLRFSWDRFFRLACQCGMRRVAYFTLKEAHVENNYEKTHAFKTIEDSIAPYEKAFFKKLLNRKKDLPYADYLFTLMLIDGMKSRIFFLTSYIKSWMQQGSQKGNIGFAAKHIASRFLKLNRAAVMLLAPAGKR